VYRCDPDPGDRHRAGTGRRYTPEDIQKLFAIPLTLAQVYSALAYADENQDEIEALYEDLKAVEEQIEREREAYLKNRSAR
jgi:hypothetical protein